MCDQRTPKCGIPTERFRDNPDHLGSAIGWEGGGCYEGLVENDGSNCLLAAVGQTGCLGRHNSTAYREMPRLGNRAHK